MRVEHMRFQMEYAASLTSASHSAPQSAPNSSGGLLRDNADEVSWDAEWDDLVLSNQTTWRRLLLEERAKLREAKLQHSQILAHSAWLAYVKKDDGHEDDTLDKVRRRIAAARPVVQRNIKHRLVLASKAARVEEGAAATVSRVLARMASTPAVPAPPSANEDPQQKATSTKTARAIGPAVSKEQGAEPISPNMPPSTSQPIQKGTASPPVRPRWGPPPAHDTAKADDGSKPPPPPPPSWVERLYKRKPQKPKPKESTPQPTAAKRRRVMPHVVRERTTAAPKKDENNVPPPECASNPSKDEHATADAPQVQNEERQEPRVTSLASKDELSKTSQPSTLHESTTRTLSTTTSPPPASHDATTSPRRTEHRAQSGARCQRKRKRASREQLCFVSVVNWRLEGVGNGRVQKQNKKTVKTRGNSLAALAHDAC